MSFLEEMTKKPALPFYKNTGFAVFALLLVVLPTMIFIFAGIAQLYEDFKKSRNQKLTDDDLNDIIKSLDRNGQISNNTMKGSMLVDPKQIEKVYQFGVSQGKT
jgi:hypothetical protein